MFSTYFGLLFLMAAFLVAFSKVLTALMMAKSYRPAWEYIPILMYGKGLKQGTDLGTRPTFADIGKTVEEYLLGSCVDDEKAIGKSFLQDIM